MIKKILHLEGLALFLLACVYYHQFFGNWFLFIALLFTPDISMIGYLRSKKVGAMLNNAIHNYVLATLLVLSGKILFNSQALTILGIILFAHVSLDRFLGYGLKYSSSFKVTPLHKP